MDRIPPIISDVQIVDMDATGYTVQCRVTDDTGILKVQFPTWTKYNEQDDLPVDWISNPSCSGKASGSIYTFRVNDSEHNFERGLYSTHIYAWDNSGNSNCAWDNNGNGSNYELSNIDFQNTYYEVNVVFHKEHTYKLYNDCLTWNEAKEKCEEFGGHLVTI